MKIINLFKKIKNVITLDALLHFLVCAIIVFSWAPIKNLMDGVIVAAVIALVKEFRDVFMLKSNTWKHSLKDILFDALGIIYAVLFITFLY